MKAFITFLIVALSLTAKAQVTDTYISFINPSILGPKSLSDGKTGLIEVVGVQYDFQSNNKKVLPGSIKLLIDEDSITPEIWSTFFTSNVPINMNIFQYRTDVKIYMTIKIRNAYINAIRFRANESEGGKHEIDIWINQFAFEYKTYGASGLVVSTHTSGWDFVNNLPFNF
jgi:hypothetical protein